MGFGSYSQGISICNKSLINFFLIVNMLQAKGGKSRVMQESSEGKINITGHSVIQQELLLTFCYTFRLISMMCLQLCGSTTYKCFLRLSFHLICHYVSSCLGILQHSLYNQVFILSDYKNNLWYSFKMFGQDWGTRSGSPFRKQFLDPVSTYKPRKEWETSHFILWS